MAEPNDVSAWTVAEVARALRRTRTTQGLRVDEVAQGAAVAVRDLQALESGSLDHFPDSLSALRTVRRSADYLGLPGDQLALVLMERWPLRAARQGVASSDPTSVVPAVGGDATVVDSEPPTVVPGDRWTGASRDALFDAAAAASGPATSEVVLDDVFEDPDATGQVQSVATGPPDRGRVPAGANEAPPAWLRAVVVAAVVVALAVVAGLVLHGLGGGKAPPSPKKSAASKPTHPVVSDTVSFTSTSTSSTSAQIVVGSSSFTVTVSAVGYRAWVQVTAPTHHGPLYAGVLQPGQSQSFPVHQTLTVDVGSVAGHIAVTVGSKKVGSYVPPAAPYHLTFKPAGS